MYTIKFGQLFQTHLFIALTHFEIFVEETLIAEVCELEVMYPLRNPPSFFLIFRDASHHLEVEDELVLPTPYILYMLKII